MSRELILDAAESLTRESHLLGWSIRDLANRLEVSPSVIYHHIGGIDALARGVVERALAPVGLPAPDLEWRAWFRELLLSLRPVALAYPGVAHWLVQHGPTVPAAMPILIGGIRVLRRDSFGELASPAYAMLLNTALMTLGVRDERLRHGVDGPRDHATMMAEFRDLAGSSAEARDMAAEFLAAFAAGGADAERAMSTYYAFAVDTVIAGLAGQLEAAGRAASAAKRGAS